MSKNENNSGKSLYEQQENKLSQQSAAFIDLLTKRGILGDPTIDDDRVRQAKKDRKKSMYHNTFLLLQHYRTILWTLECFPSDVAEELDHPLRDLDTLLDRIDVELGMNNRKLESRMESIRRSRLLVDRLNEAVSILKSKPANGRKMYDIIYMTFLGPDKLTHEELLYRLDISARHYYRKWCPAYRSFPSVPVGCLLLTDALQERCRVLREIPVPLRSTEVQPSTSMRAVLSAWHSALYNYFWTLPEPECTASKRGTRKRIHRLLQSPQGLDAPTGAGLFLLIPSCVSLRIQICR